MLRVTVEIVPHGRETHKQIIGVLEIVNIATGTLKEGDYIARLHPGPAEQVAPPRRTVDFEGFARGAGAYKLVQEVLKKLTDD